MKRALIACEFSGTVRDAFRSAGWDAWSADLLPTTKPGQHYQRCVLGLLRDNWDLMIAHPPCTYLASSGLHWNGRIEGREAQTAAAVEFVRELLDAPIARIALENPIGRISTAIRPFDQKIQPWQFGQNASKATCLWLKNLPRLRATAIVPPAHYHQVTHGIDLPICECCEEEAYCPTHEEHFADCQCIGRTQDKATYKTIEGFDFATLDQPPPKCVWANQTPSGQNKLGPSADRWALRSITYQGIADAMAAQWTAAIDAELVIPRQQEMFT